MDADDVALPTWLERLVARIQAGAGRRGRRHRDDRPPGRRSARDRAPAADRRRAPCAGRRSSRRPSSTRPCSLDRAVLERHGLRYDTSFGESEDFDLWARLLEHADGDNLPEALVLYRKHPAQASTRRAELQRECQRRVALRQIAALAPAARRRGAPSLRGAPARGCPSRTEEAGGRGGGARAKLVAAFERRHGGARRDGRRRGRLRGAGASPRRLRLDPALPLHGASARRRRRRAARAERDAAARWLAALARRRARSV